MTLKVIGAGFGRTGTLSLKAALEELGFDKCYHMREVFENRGHAEIWSQRARGQAIDWDALFEGYQAIVDWPGCSFYQDLMAHYPDAKVLLTVRDPERWYDSAYNTIYPSSRSGMMYVLDWLGVMKYVPRMINQLIWQGTFQGRFEDKAYAIQAFNDHLAEVKRIVPPEKLLVYSVKEGWAPLCKFLGVPVPVDKPFPHLNDTADFKKVVKRRTLIYRLLMVGVGGVVAVGVGLGLKRRVKRG